MTNDQAYAELGARRIPFEAATPPLPGVRAPIRLRGPLEEFLAQDRGERISGDQAFALLDAALSS